MKTFGLCLLTALAIGAPAVHAASDTGYGSTTREQRMDQALQNYRDGANRNGSRSRNMRSATNRTSADTPVRDQGDGPAARAEEKVKRGARKAGHAVAEGGRKVGHAVANGARKVRGAVSSNTKPAPE